LVDEEPAATVPDECGSTTLSASNVAALASNAEPPATSIVTPAAAARRSAAETMARGGRALALVSSISGAGAVAQAENNSEDKNSVGNKTESDTDNP
jgi:hypothetical protein